jgi:hypothetical protein
VWPRLVCCQPRPPQFSPANPDLPGSRLAAAVHWPIHQGSTRQPGPHPAGSIIHTTILTQALSQQHHSSVYSPASRIPFFLPLPPPQGPTRGSQQAVIPPSAAAPTGGNPVLSPAAAPVLEMTQSRAPGEGGWWGLAASAAAVCRSMAGSLVLPKQTLRGAYWLSWRRIY